MSKDQLSKSLVRTAASSGRTRPGRRTNNGWPRAHRQGARSFASSQSLSRTEIFKLDLNKAADEVRKSRRTSTPHPNRSCAKWQSDSRKPPTLPGQGLEKLSRISRQHGEAMQRRDTAAGQQGLRQVATELERLQRVLESQRLRRPKPVPNSQK